MAYNNNSTIDPVAETMEQQAKGGEVDPKNITDEMESNSQKSVRNEQVMTPAVEQGQVETPTPTVEGENSQQVRAEDCPTQKAEKKEKAKKEAPKKDFKPDYPEEKQKELAIVTKIGEEELHRLMTYSKGVVFPIGEDNLVINLMAFIRNGGVVVTPVVNREHGKDQERTGESILTYGAQRQLLFITKRMADAAGMAVTRFSNDKSTIPIPDDALVMLDGNGRMNYIFGLEDSMRPNIYATFIVKDALGYYNPRKVMEVINTEIVIWKTQDMVQKRQLEDGEGAHEGWSLIQQLIKKDYKYQSACQCVTLNTDRIKSKEVTTGDSSAIFIHFKSAKRIHKALVERFGEGEDNTLKTKEFTREVSVLWNKLQRKSGDDIATEQFIKFIQGLKDSKVNEIKSAKNVKGGLKKDDIRKNILNEQFNQFIGKEGIELD